MKPQNYANHKQLVPAYHYVLAPLAMITLFFTLAGTIKALFQNTLTYGVLFFLSLSVLTAGILLYCRIFALKAQDRAIRAEENLRHYVLTGKLLDSRLNVKQIVALRFAGDEEFPKLCERAVEQQLSPNEIKRAIQNWRSDIYRV